MTKELIGFKCKYCGYILDAIETKCKFNVFEYCPRCKSIEPFNPIFKEVRNECE